MKKQKLLVLLAAVCLLFTLFSFSASAEGVTNGWVNNGDDTWSYYENGAQAFDKWIYDGYNWYYIDYNGLMLTNSFVYDNSGECYVDNNGRIVKDKWFETKRNEYDDLSWYYADKNGYIVKDYWAKDSVGWCYLNYEGRMLFDDYVEEYNENTGRWTLYYINESGYMVSNAWKKDTRWDAGEEWLYFSNSGAAYYAEVAKINGIYYAFDDNYQMVSDGSYEFYDYKNEKWVYVVAKADGSLVTNKWEQVYVEWEEEYEWMYYGPTGAAYANEVAQIGGKYYGFNGNGHMYDGTGFFTEYYDDDKDEWVITGNYRAKAGGELYVGRWYADEWENWYYYGADGKAAVGICTIGGKTYCFNEYGRMGENEVVEVEVNGTTQLYFCDENGVATRLYNNTWTEMDGEWYYVQNGELCTGGFYTINGVLYYFGWDGEMYADTSFSTGEYDEELDTWIYYEYYAKPEGNIAVNEWVKRYGNWYYYGDKGRAPEPGLRKIGGAWYYFYSDGMAVYSTVMETEDGVYVFNKDCFGKKVVGWFTHPENQDSWMYALADGTLAYDGVYEIGGYEYVFDYEGLMLANQVYGDYVFAKDGKRVLGSGWYTLDGEYVYLVSSRVVYGWYEVNGTYYYFNPEMSYCELLTDDGKLYSTAGNGKYKALTAKGFYTDGDVTYYVLDNGYLANGWQAIGDYWYYFGDNYEYGMSTGYVYDNGSVYYLDVNGKMACSGWGMDTDGDWYWAASNGVLFTGKDSAGYLFSEGGWLYEDGVHQYNGVNYVTDKNGKVVATLSYGWNQVGSDWYYIDEEYNYAVSGGFTDPKDGRRYYFDYNTYKMVTNLLLDSRYYGADGAAVKGWIQLDGKWYYGDEDAWLCWDGIYEIKGKDYLFSGRVLQTNKTLLYGNEVVSTNADGVVVSKTDANGWVYDVDEYGNGNVYYYKNGKEYNGWLGNYYIENSRMAVDEIVYDENTDKYYYVGANGLCVKNQWYDLYRSEDYDAWILARADGSLVRDDWYSNGKNWYYFSEFYMVSDGVCEIDGTYNRFDENGIWLGELSGYSDGWQKIGGDWYYFIAGQPVTYRTIYENGQVYQLDGEGKMVTNRFYSQRYHLADGRMAKYTGWQWINGRWCYFNSQYQAVYGWFKDGGATYYQDYIYDEAKDQSFFGIYTGTVVIDDGIYQFTADGQLIGEIVKDGWHNIDGFWYYIKNGELITGEGEVSIGGAKYAFYASGEMVANNAYDGRYYNADGIMVTKAGWYLNSYNKYVYVNSNGRVCEGYHLINGVEYYFLGYELVE